MDPAINPTPTNMQTQADLQSQAIRQTPANIQTPATMISPISMQTLPNTATPANVRGPLNMQPLDNMQTPANVPALTPMQTPAIRRSPTDITMQTPAYKPTPVNTQQLISGDRRMFFSSEDNIMSKQIQTTHALDASEVNVKPLLRIAEDIFNRSSSALDAIISPGIQAHVETFDDKAYQASFIGMLEDLVSLIDRISCELACKCSGGGDAHSTTMAILNTLSSYTWDSKLVLALSAFAVNYGEFWLLAQSYTSNPLAKSMAILKQLPEILEHTSNLKPRFDSIKMLIKAVLDISKCIIKFRDLPSQYITMEVAALSTATAHVPIAVYWTIRSIVACASQITSLTGLGHEYFISTTETWELSSLAHKVTNMRSHLETQLETCYKHIEEKKHIEAYQYCIHLFETPQIDNMKILKALLNPRDDPQPLIEGATKKRVTLDGLRRKFVLLLISDLDISQMELDILEQIYNVSRMHPTKAESQYEVVWLQIVDPSVPWTETKQKQFQNLQTNMQWYSVPHPSLIDSAVIKFIRDKWHFGNKPILVVLDPQGRVACPNALHMMWIWGDRAFPFTTAREEAIWKEETWGLELLVNGIDQTILNWITEGRFICLYGGEDIEWIRKLTNTAKTVAQAAGVSLGMVYVGKSNPKERVRKNISIIIAENLSHYWQDLNLIWYFWVRLESMWHSKNQLGRKVEDDPIMQQIMAMLTFDSSEGGWVVLGRGSTELIKSKGGQFIEGLAGYDQWKEQVPEKGYVKALGDHLHEIQTPHHCNKLVLPGASGMIPEKVACSECGKIMERYIMYQCCDE
ncbi:hypothetical protein CFOL_v3_33337 [Cephalotus follicularis]|uniref:Uncharacterized protein n=1 Tax=Cephalotus follicularis TaxID=3775 RepID=A0A1Q3DBL7_CEPFO|nr:hypothetical protein CFOL_v3_33337 [Cephalotus follicularis]